MEKKLMKNQYMLIKIILFVFAFSCELNAEISKATYSLKDFIELGLKNNSELDALRQQEKIISLKEKIKKEREYREGLIKERRILDDRRNEINKILNKEVEYDENYQETEE